MCLNIGCRQGSARRKRHLFWPFKTCGDSNTFVPTKTKWLNRDRLGFGWDGYYQNWGKGDLCRDINLWYITEYNCFLKISGSIFLTKIPRFFNTLFRASNKMEVIKMANETMRTISRWRSSAILSMTARRMNYRTWGIDSRFLQKIGYFCNGYWKVNYGTLYWKCNKN